MRAIGSYESSSARSLDTLAAYVGSSSTRRTAARIRGRPRAFGAQVDAEAVPADARVDVVLALALTRGHDRHTVAHRRQHTAEPAIGDEDVDVREQVVVVDEVLDDDVRRGEALPQLFGLGTRGCRNDDVRTVLEGLQRGHDELVRVGVVDGSLRNGDHLRVRTLGRRRQVAGCRDRAPRARARGLRRTPRCPAVGNRETPGPGDPLRNTRRALASGTCGNPSSGIGAMPWRARMSLYLSTPALMVLASMRRTTRCTVRPTMVRAGRRPKKGGGLWSSGMTVRQPDGEHGDVRGPRRPASRRRTRRRRRRRRTGTRSRISTMSWKWLSTLATKNFSRSNEISFGPLSVRPLREERVDVPAGDLRCPAVGEIRHAERLELAGVLGAGVPADVVTAQGQVRGDAGERVEVPVGRHGCEQDPHGCFQTASRRSVRLTVLTVCERCPPVGAQTAPLVVD